jgi:molybdopterin converting factor small subunit
MRLTIRLFASYADAFGTPDLAVEVPEAATVSDVVAAVRALPEAGRLPPRPVVAVNRRYATDVTPVGPADEVALIPPVAGG